MASLKCTCCWRRILLVCAVLWWSERCVTATTVLVPCGQTTQNIISNVSYTMIDCGCSTSTLFLSNGTISNVSIVAVNSSVTFYHSAGDVQQMSFTVRNFSDVDCRPTNSRSTLFTIAPADRHVILSVSNLSIDLMYCNLAIVMDKVVNDSMLPLFVIDNAELTQHVAVNVLSTVVEWTPVIPPANAIVPLFVTTLFLSTATTYRNISLACRGTTLLLLSMPQLVAMVRIIALVSGTLAHVQLYDSQLTMRSVLALGDLRSDFYFLRVEGATASEHANLMISANNLTAILDAVLAHRLILFEVCCSVMIRNLTINLVDVNASTRLTSTANLAVNTAIFSDYTIGQAVGVNITALNVVFAIFFDLNIDRPLKSESLSSYGFSFSNVTTLAGAFENVSMKVSLRGAFLTNRVKLLLVEYLYFFSSGFLLTVGSKDNSTVASSGALVFRNVSISSSFSNIVAYSGPLIGASIGFSNGIAFFPVNVFDVSIVVESCSVLLSMLPDDITTSGTLQLSGMTTLPVKWNVTAGGTLVGLSWPMREADVYDSVDIKFDAWFRLIVRQALLRFIHSFPARNVTLLLNNSNASVARSPTQQVVTSRLTSTAMLLALGMLSASRFKATHCQADVGLFGAPGSNLTSTTVLLENLNGLGYVLVYVAVLQSVSIDLRHTPVRFLGALESVSQDRHAIAQPVLPVVDEPLVPVVFRDCRVSLSGNIFIGYEALFPPNGRSLAYASQCAVCGNLWRSEGSSAMVETTTKDIGDGVGFNLSESSMCLFKNISAFQRTAASKTSTASGGVTVVVAVLGSLASSAVSVAGSVMWVQRSALAGSMIAYCRVVDGDGALDAQDAVQLGFSDSPTGLVVAGSALTGAVVGNTVLVVAIALVGLLWGLRATISAASDNDSLMTMMQAALRRARLPSSVVWAFVFLLQSTVSSSVATLGGGSSAFVGVLGLIVCAAPIMLCLWRVYESRMAITASSQLVKPADRCPSQARRAFEFLFQPSCEWSVRRTSDGIRWEQVMQCYGGLFEEHRIGARFFTFVDMSCSVLCGVVGGTVFGGWWSSSNCVSSVWITLALCSSLFLLTVVGRPCATRFGNAVLVINGGMTVVCVMLTLTEDNTAASDTLTLIQSTACLASVLVTTIAAAIADGRPPLVQLKQCAVKVFVPALAVKLPMSKLWEHSLVTSKKVLGLVADPQFAFENQPSDRLRVLVMHICEASRTPKRVPS